MINNFSNNLICRCFTNFNENFELTKARVHAWHSNVANLTELTFAYRQLTSISRNAFEQLSHIKTLILSENRLVTLDSFLFLDQTQLEVLKLNRNALAGVLDSNLFATLSQLKMLDLSVNKLTSLNAQIFSRLYRIEEINLSSNNLLSIDRNVFLGLLNLERVYLSENPIGAIQTSNFVQLCYTNPKCKIYL